MINRLNDANSDVETVLETGPMQRLRVCHAANREPGDLPNRSRERESDDL